MHIGACAPIGLINVMKKIKAQPRSHISVNVKNYKKVYQNALICSKGIEQNVIFNINQGP